MKNWQIYDVPEDKRKEFIISCLSGYISEVEEIIEDNDRWHYPEILDIAELYKEIIKLLKD